MRQTAKYWAVQPDGLVKCGLCPHECVLAEGRAGRCGVRCVKDGMLTAAGYGRISSAHMDPIEKKPLYHFLPGKNIFSIGGWGCNLSCVFCQNWSISQQAIEDGEVVESIETADRVGLQGSIGLAYTYNEPLVGIEYVMDCARLVHARGLRNVLVTNGFVSTGPAHELLPFIDALNVDIKSISDSFYRRYCGGRLEPVLEFCRMCVEKMCHLEITNLIIPGLNDGEKDLKDLAEWIACNLGKSVPLHLSGYHPQYKLDVCATSKDILENAYAVCSEILDYVYIGNIATEKGRNTYCRGCGSELVSRSYYDVCVKGITDGKCSSCGKSSDIVI